jgi:proteasome alpha subunit
MKPYEVEIVVAEVGARPDDDQIYRISWDGSVSDEPGFVAFGGQAEQVSAALKEAFSDNMSLPEALAAAMTALTAPASAPPAASGAAASSTAANGAPAELTAAQLEVAILDRARAHRTFRRLQGPRLEELLAESRSAAPTAAEPAPAVDTTPPATGPAPASAPSSDDPPTGPAAGSDGIPKPPKSK